MTTRNYRAISYPNYRLAIRNLSQKIPRKFISWKSSTARRVLLLYSETSTHFNVWGPSLSNTLSKPVGKSNAIAVKTKESFQQRQRQTRNRLWREEDGFQQRQHAAVEIMYIYCINAPQIDATCLQIEPLLVNVPSLADYSLLLSAFSRKNEKLFKKFKKHEQGLSSAPI